MTDATHLSPVTAEHVTYFGFIINFFAKIELQIQLAVAGILGTDLATAVILMDELGSRQKIQTLKHLNTTIGIGGAFNSELANLLDDIGKQAKLRNWIAHATWTEGQRSGSIKPMRLHLRGDEPVPLGHHHNERDYTVADLKNEAAKLDDIDRRFRALLKSTGMQDRVEAKMAEINSPTDELPG